MLSRILHTGYTSWGEIVLVRAKVADEANVRYVRYM